MMIFSHSALRMKSIAHSSTVNNNLYITAILKKETRIFIKNQIYHTLRICFACRSHLSMHFTALFSVGDRLSYETFLSAVYFGVLSLKEIKYLVFCFFQHKKTYLKADTWIKGPGKVLSLYKSLSWSDDWVRQLSMAGKAFRQSALEEGNSSVWIWMNQCSEQSSLEKQVLCLLQDQKVHFWCCNYGKSALS